MPMANSDATRSPRPVRPVDVEIAFRMVATRMAKTSRAGGNSGCERCPCAWFAGTGLKIWISWTLATRQRKPALQASGWRARRHRLPGERNPNAAV